MCAFLSPFTTVIFQRKCLQDLAKDFKFVRKMITSYPCVEVFKGEQYCAYYVMCSWFITKFIIDKMWTCWQVYWPCHQLRENRHWEKKDYVNTDVLRKFSFNAQSAQVFLNDYIVYVIGDYFHDTENNTLATILILWQTSGRNICNFILISPWQSFWISTISLLLIYVLINYLFTQSNGNQSHLFI